MDFSFLPPEPTEVDSSQLASAIVDILREQGAVNEALLLSSLGQRLSARFGQPLRTIIGDKRLSDVVNFALGGLVRFEGEGNRRAIRLDGSAGSEKRPIRYDPSFWAAFSKPIAEGGSRWLQTERPFDFDDILESSREFVDRIRIDPTLIPAADVPKPERDAFIRKSIDAWCSLNRLPPARFLIKPTHSGTTGRVDPDNISKKSVGITALRDLIEAIPPESRHKYSLSMDLIHQLIS